MADIVPPIQSIAIIEYTDQQSLKPRIRSQIGISNESRMLQRPWQYRLRHDVRDELSCPLILGDERPLSTPVSAGE
jgi:hypothetical protein